MAIQRIFRRSLTAFVAGFLIVIAVGPTEQGRTIWQLAGGKHPEQTALVISAGTHFDPIVQRSRLPGGVDLRVRWRLRIAEHYARRDQLRQQRDRIIAAQESETDREKSGIRTVGYTPGPPLTDLASLVEPSANESPWSRHQIEAQEAADKIDALYKNSRRAIPVAYTPGDPTRGAMLAAVLIGCLLALVVGGLTVIDRPEPPCSPLDDSRDLLSLPGPWFHVRPTLASRFVQWTRRASVMLIIVLVSLTAVRLADAPLAWQRITTWPLAEFAASIPPVW